MSVPDVLIDRVSVNDINAAMTGNARRQITWSSPVDVVFDAAHIAADAPRLLAHDLGLQPNTIDVIPWQGATWWADVGDRRLWTEKTIAFHASADGRYTVRAGIQ